jgi:hypothetical protein
MQEREAPGLMMASQVDLELTFSLCLILLF